MLDRKTEYLARKVEKIEEVQKAMQTSHKGTAQKLEQILLLLTPKNIKEMQKAKQTSATTPPSNGYYLSSYEEQS